MKYKVGDKVKMKVYGAWHKDYKNAINELPDRVATIEKIDRLGYRMKGLDWSWSDLEIEYLVEGTDWIPIDNRFEILDL